jgi:hypothetical protein
MVGKGLRVVEIEIGAAGEIVGGIPGRFNARSDSASSAASNSSRELGDAIGVPDAAGEGVLSRTSWVGMDMICCIDRASVSESGSGIARNGDEGDA